MIKLDKEKLTRLYKEEGWSITALTEEFKVGRETIKSNIEFYNIILSAEDLITARKFREERKKQNLLQKYGVDNVSKIKEVRDKVSEGNKKYQEKLKEEGITPFFGTEEGKKAAREGVLRKYGTDNINKTEQRRNEMKENWNKKSDLEKKEWAEKCRKAQTKESLEKYKRTNFQKYNTEYFIKLPEIQKKAYEGRQRNGAFITSIEENEVGKLLKEKFPDLKTQYRDDDRYPFTCDFYIPSLDLFIEYQGYWTHGGEPYTGTENQLKIVEGWKRKSDELNFKGKFKKSYKIAINTWTVSDVQKRETAKENKLNWVEFFNKESLIEFINGNKDNSN